LILVRAYANRASETMPGMSHAQLLAKRSQAQKAKQPPISANAASKYHARVFIKPI
jgi:hypothetical protein